MHSRRLSVFILGSWLFGTLLMAFVLSQSEKNIERIINSPPPNISKEIDEVGRGTVARLFRQQAAHLDRHLQEAWDYLQLGLGASLLTISCLGAKKLNPVICCALSMFLLAGLFAFYFTPSITVLSLFLDGAPPMGATEERNVLRVHEIMRTSLETLKVLIGLYLTFLMIFWDKRRKVELEPLPVGSRHRVRRPPSSLAEGAKPGKEFEIPKI